MKCTVKAVWDADVKVLVATNQDIPGLVTEADTLETLTTKLREMIAELMILNEIISEDYSGSINFQRL